MLFASKYTIKYDSFTFIFNCVVLYLQALGDAHISLFMKNFGSKSEYAQERTRDLLKAYFRYLKTCKHIRMPEVFKHIVEMPASRFWVSSQRAAVVVASIIRGDDLHYMRSTKREMFFEIYRRVVELRATRPELSLLRLVEIVLALPAPKFYLSPGSARVLILKARKQWFSEKLKKHQGC